MELLVITSVIYMLIEYRIYVDNSVQDVLGIQ